MFGKLGIALAGAVALGLLTTGAPAFASTSPDPGAPGATTLTAGTAPGTTGARTVRDLVRQTSTTVLHGQIRVTVTRSATPAGLGTMAAQAARPYTVTVENQTADAFEIRLYWEEKNTTGVFGGSAPLAAYQTSSYDIAGPDGCNVLLRYLLQFWYAGELAGQTGITYPSTADLNLCADAWAIGYL